MVVYYSGEVGCYFLWFCRYLYIFIHRVLFGSVFPILCYLGWAVWICVLGVERPLWLVLSLDLYKVWDLGLWYSFWLLLGLWSGRLGSYCHWFHTNGTSVYTTWIVIKVFGKNFQCNQNVSASASGWFCSESFCYVVFGWYVGVRDIFRSYVLSTHM